jgi:carboxymethylenebutenolidase
VASSRLTRRARTSAQERRRRACFTKEQAATLEQTLTALGERYQLEHYEARHGWAVIDTPVYDAAEAERHWTAILALFAAELGR